MTELAYLETIDAAYSRRFRGTVVSLPPGSVVLDRTLFYPTGGGQPHDTGTLRGPDGFDHPVVDVTRSGSAVLHRLRANPGPRLHPGDTVDGTIDWERRHRFMRMHSAQHLVSAMAFVRTGLRTSRAELREGDAVIDLERPWPVSIPWEEFPTELDRELGSARPIEVRLVPRAEWNRAPSGRSALVPLPPYVDPVRVIDIRGVDECPCGGTHVRSTGEIGSVAFAGPPTPRGPGCRLRFTLGGPAPPTSNA